MVFSGCHAGSGSRFETCGGGQVEKIEKISRTRVCVCSSSKEIVLTCVDSECLPRVVAEKLR